MKIEPGDVVQIDPIDPDLECCIGVVVSPEDDKRLAELPRGADDLLVAFMAPIPPPEEHRRWRPRVTVVVVAARICVPIGRARWLPVNGKMVASYLGEEAPRGDVPALQRVPEGVVGAPGDAVRSVRPGPDRVLPVGGRLEGLVPGANAGQGGGDLGHARDEHPGQEAPAPARDPGEGQPEREAGGEHELTLDDLSPAERTMLLEEEHARIVNHAEVANRAKANRRRAAERARAPIPTGGDPAGDPFEGRGDYCAEHDGCPCDGARCVDPVNPDAIETWYCCVCCPGHQAWTLSSLIGSAGEIERDFIAGKLWVHRVPTDPTEHSEVQYRVVDRRVIEYRLRYPRLKWSPWGLCSLAVGMLTRAVEIVPAGSEESRL